MLADDQVLQPDIMLISKARVHLIKENGLFGALDLAVEVLSPTSRRYDTGRKRELYLQHGCLEMWIIDPAELTVTQPVRSERRWVETTLTREDLLVSVAIEGFRLRVSEIAPRPEFFTPEADESPSALQSAWTLERDIEPARNAHSCLTASLARAELRHVPGQWPGTFLPHADAAVPPTVSRPNHAVW